MVTEAGSRCAELRTHLKLLDGAQAGAGASAELVRGRETLSVIDGVAHWWCGCCGAESVDRVHVAARAGNPGAALVGVSARDCTVGIAGRNARLAL